MAGLLSKPVAGIFDTVSNATAEIAEIAGDRAAVARLRPRRLFIGQWVTPYSSVLRCPPVAVHTATQLHRGFSDHRIIIQFV